VHEDHGVGRYRGLESLDVGGHRAEFLAIEYAKGDKLYVPVAQLHLVSRYAGASPELAPLHSLGGEQWEKAKKKAAEKVRDVAAELLEIQAKRQRAPASRWTFDRAMYEQFAAQFPFEETPDQLSAIEAVITDLGSSQPMDRVVCGDVGFGKTEVAVRAAFVAASAGKQVALLVPTTLLAEQHYRNFRDRFADWPLRVEVLSRFKTAKEIKAELLKLAEGKIDVIVGTHRLLQEDVKFKDLGLVIVDEEQRFGVRQKERSRRCAPKCICSRSPPRRFRARSTWRWPGCANCRSSPRRPRIASRCRPSSVPMGCRPAARSLPARTARGGQVYFLHNEVESIERMARELAELVPEARIRVAHGQMPERELEQVMLDFHRQRFNVLVCTTIIESGIDIPSANTIIIHRADKFGLAQLHQLRGRVGRSHHRAYAYLVVPDKKSITATRPSGWKRSPRWTNSAPASPSPRTTWKSAAPANCWAKEQSGQITEVGFSLYTELLERAVRSIKQGKMPDLDGADRHGADVELHLPALIPDDYLPDVHARLTLYKRIASARDAMPCANCRWRWSIASACCPSR
jgi:transcription-repair coupling factor (superfamily II helicase)